MKKEIKKYMAYFSVDGAVSHGFGLKSPDVYEKTTEINARGDSRAYKSAIYKAAKLAADGLSNPDTGETRVTLSRLECDGELVEIPAKTIIVSCSEFCHINFVVNPRLITRFKKGIKERLGKLVA